MAVEMLKALHEKRQGIAKRLKELAEGYATRSKDGTWKTEDEANWAAVNKDYDACKSEIECRERLDRAEEINAAIASSSGQSNLDRYGEMAKRSAGGVKVVDDAEEVAEEELAEEDEDADTEFRGKKNLIRAKSNREHNTAFRAWANFHRSGGRLTKLQKEACRSSGIDPSRNYVDLPLARDFELQEIRQGLEKRALGITTNLGAETIAPEFMQKFEQALLYFGGMRQSAETIRTATGASLPWPTFNDTTNVGALLAQATTIGASVDPATAAVTFSAYKYSSKPILVNAELLDDSAFDLPSRISQMLGERIGRILNTHFTTGTGAGQPNGIVTAMGAADVTATAGQLTMTTVFADNIQSLIHNLDPAYRQAGCSFMMNDNTVLRLRGIKDTTNQYIWQSGMAIGVPDRLFGYPIVINQDMATVAASAKVILFGQLSAYKIRDVASYRLRRLVERYADTDQEAYIAFTRHDGQFLTAGVKPVKMLAMNTT